MEATVVEAMANDMFRVECSDGQRIVAHIAANARLGIVRIIPGDRVLIEISTYDGTRGRITGLQK